MGVQTQVRTIGIKGLNKMGKNLRVRVRVKVRIRLRLE